MLPTFGHQEHVLDSCLGAAEDEQLKGQMDAQDVADCDGEPVAEDQSVGGADAAARYAHCGRHCHRSGHEEALHHWQRSQA